jgi:FKBP-type peptidyl-prolyl cis-trans isomerase
MQAQEVKFNVPGQTAAPAPAAPQAAPAPVAAPAAPEQTFTEAQIMESFGWFVAARIGVNSLEFTPEQISSFVKGVGQAASGKDAPYELGKIGPAMDQFIQQRQMVAMGKLKAKNDEASAAFFAAIKAKPGVTVLPSGLAFEIVQPGTGESPKPTDTVTVHYTGALIDGHVFDSSVKRGAPETIALTEVVPGWTEGLQKINKGGKIKLYVPAALGYGERGAGEIPPGATLIFDIELIDFGPTPAPAAAAPAPASK